MDIEEIQSNRAVDLLAENKRLETENEKLKKAIVIADKDRQDAWRTLKVIRDALK